jgi:hypothetical protein
MLRWQCGAPGAGRRQHCLIGPGWFSRVWNVKLIGYFAPRISMADIWKQRPEAHDYPAALDYLTLLMEEKAAKRLVSQLRKAPTVHKKAKDLLRASRLPLLPRDNLHVAGDLKKIKKGKAMSPVLLVRGEAARDLPLVVADGYHRICASWYRDENIPIACRIVSLES